MWGETAVLAACNASSSVRNGSPDLDFVHDGQERGVQVAQQRQGLQQAGRRLSAGLASAVAAEQSCDQHLGHHSFQGSKPTWEARTRGCALAAGRAHGRLSATLGLAHVTDLEILRTGKQLRHCSTDLVLGPSAASWGSAAGSKGPHALYIASRECSAGMSLALRGVVDARCLSEILQSCSPGLSEYTSAWSSPLAYAEGCSLTAAMELHVRCPWSVDCIRSTSPRA